MQIQNASHTLKYLRESAVEAVRDREVNLSAPIYLLSAAVNSLGRKWVNKPEITEVELYTFNIASYNHIVYGITRAL